MHGTRNLETVTNSNFQQVSSVTNLTTRIFELKISQGILTNIVNNTDTNNLFPRLLVLQFSHFCKGCEHCSFHTFVKIVGIAVFTLLQRLWALQFSHFAQCLQVNILMVLKVKFVSSLKPTLCICDVLVLNLLLQLLIRFALVSFKMLQAGIQMWDVWKKSQFAS